VDRFAGAAPELAAMSFTTLLRTTFELLHCVTVDGNPVVFRSAGVRCDGQAAWWWRVPVMLVAAALLMPVLAALLARAFVWRGLPTPSPRRQLRQQPRQRWAAVAMARLRVPFKARYWHWGAVLALQRLCCVAVYTLTHEAATRAVLQVLLAALFLNLHVYSRPFVRAAAQRVQTALLSLLVCIATVNVPVAVMQAAAFTPQASTPMAGLLDRLSDAYVMLLALPAAAATAAMLPLLWESGRLWLCARSERERGAAPFESDTESSGGHLLREEGDRGGHLHSASESSIQLDTLRESLSDTGSEHGGPSGDLREHLLGEGGRQGHFHSAPPSSQHRHTAHSRAQLASASEASCHSHGHGHGSSNQLDE
jgi:hypothetical protein